MKLCMLYVLFFFLQSVDLFAQCPEVRFIMVDACTGSGNERDNEFFVLDSGPGFAVDDLGFTTPTGTVTASSTNPDDFNPSNPCSSCLTGCTINFITNGDVVPANRHVVVFTSRNLNFMSYDMSGLCVQGELYVLIANATPGSGQFANWSGANCSGCNPVSGDPMRTLQVTLTGGCSAEATYSRCLLRNLAGNCGAQDGGAVTFENGVALYNNNGCFAPVLPVEFGEFTLAIVEDAVRLDWTTFTEVNNDYFTIQRSVDGVRFEDIGRVGGAGFSNNMHEYTFTDDFPLPGILYYRIRQTDFDGKISFSEVRFIRNNTESARGKVRFFYDEIRIQGGEEHLDISIYDSSGKLMYTTSGQPGETFLKIEFLNRGVYILVVQNHLFYETFRFFR